MNQRMNSLSGSLTSAPGSGETPHLSLCLGVLEPVNVLAGRAVIAGHGQLEHAIAAVEIDDVLDRALAVGPLADDHGPLVVLKRGRRRSRRPTPSFG